MGNICRMSNDPVADEGKWWEPSLGERLAVARRDRGLSQEWMATHLDVSVQTISRYENDIFPRKGMSEKKLQLWADATKYNLQWLSTGRKPQVSAPPPPPIPIDRKRTARRQPSTLCSQFSNQVAA